MRMGTGMYMSLFSKISDFAVDVSIGVNSYWAQGLKPPTFMIMGLAYMTSPPLL